MVLYRGQGIDRRPTALGHRIIYGGARGETLALRFIAWATPNVLLALILWRVWS